MEAKEIVQAIEVDNIWANSVLYRDSRYRYTFDSAGK